MKFAEILLPVPLNQTFTYAYEDGINLMRGMRVVVPFGKRKFITGLVISVHDNAPKDYTAKEIAEVLDDAAIMSNQQLQFMSWMADYYMCTDGEVLNSALPSGLKISSESNITLNPTWSGKDKIPLHESEELIIEVLEQRHSITYNDVIKLLGPTKSGKIIKSLEQKKIIDIYQEVREKYTPKTEKYVRLKDTFLTDKGLEKVFNKLSSSPKQEEVLLAFLQEASNPNSRKKGISKKQLLKKDISPSSLKTLIKNEIFEEIEIEVSRFEEVSILNKAPQLTEDQQVAYDEILTNFEDSKPVLLHGITGSGKTAIYVNLIQDTIESGHQALLLLPEIALTTQIVQRLKEVFGDVLGVYHSKFSDNERVEVWMGVLTGKFQCVVGVRSSLFLPYDNLGLIIVDEEHETSYKQYDPAPRYHARDAALMLSQFHKAHIVMGSATPSMESYFQAEGDKYGLVNLTRRYGKAVLPKISTVDLGSAIKKKTINGHFTEVLLDEIKQVLTAKRQVIIFQNRRGYAPFLECQNCGWVPKCINCAVSLTYHQYQKQLRCHYCGFHQKLPSECEECTSTLLQTMGFGTEKLEEDLQLLLPEAKIQRMDLETTRAKYSYQRIIEDFASGKTDILVGTQMVTKGLDFDNVALVGIIDFDRMLHFPDFRSYERTFDLTLQVSGRAGRSADSGKVMIQTYNPKQHILELIIKGDFITFYNRELSERSRFDYPPFTRLIRIIMKHRDRSVVADGSQALARGFRQHFEDYMVLGPEAPMISRVKNKYLMELTIKLPRKNFNLRAAKEVLKHEALLLERHPVFKNIQIVFDVDPF